jgi:hypothetical protein
MRKKTYLLLLFVFVWSTFFTVLNAQVIFEAEDAYISAGFVDTKHPGYTGDGFVDTENMLDVFVEWTINSLKNVTDPLGFRYALGKDENRLMQVVLNDVLIDTIDFDRSGEFTDYIYKYTVGTIVEGTNSIKLVSINTEGAPNLDHLTLKIDTNKYLQVNATVSGSGTVNVIPEADSFQYGTRVTLIPVAGGGNAFSGWTGDYSGTRNPLSFTVDKDYSVQAHFLNILPAFPGAEGFAKNVTGGRGGIVVEVTNLNDNGAGSLRAAIGMNQKRTIVFRVSGTIDLNSNLSITNGDVTIAGQTAPGDGITLSGYPLKVSADNVIVRFIRSRLGDEKLIEDDAMNGRYNDGVMLDHCTMSWSVDETGSFYDNTNFTMQYCLLSESLYHSIHDKGNHGYGGIWGGQNATFHHNMLAHHTSRNPRFCGSRYTNEADLEKVDFRNNVIYNWGGNSIYGAEGGSYNLVNNYFKYGPATSSSVRSRIIAPNADDGTNSQPAGVWGVFYVDGNYVNKYPAITENNWSGVHASIGDKSEIRSDMEFECDTVTTTDAQVAFEHVLAQVGTVLPKRDIVDTRIIHEALTGTATYGATYGSGTGIIDTQGDVGGWPVLESTTPPDDSDKDGMPDEWETNRGLNPNDPEDRNGDDNGNGYTNLEEYLNELVAAYTYIIRPINLMVASFDPSQVVLEWEDVVEGETAFLLERRFENEDYIQIAEIAANANTYTDEINTIGIISYRLRAINEIDTSFYTDTVFVDIPNAINTWTAQESQIKVFPNPFTDELAVSFNISAGQNLNISLIDIHGRTVKVMYDDYLEAGQNKLSWQLGDIPDGFYTLSIRSAENLFLKKLIKK